MTTLLTTSQTGMLMLLLPFLLIAIATDLARRRIPNFLVIFMLGSGLLLHVSLLGLVGLAWSLGGVALGLFILLPFYALGGMGAGDVKLLAAAGSFLGPWGVLLAGLFTLAAGGVLGVGVIVWRRLAGGLATRFERLPRAWVTTSMEAGLPYSLAISAGTVVALYALNRLDAGGLQVAMTMGGAPW